MNRLFPELSLSTSEISRKIERGRHTTREVELFPLSDELECGYVADTPGFSMLDFERFDFFGKEDLPNTFREFEPYIGQCRYTKCTHTKEDGCAVLAAVISGDIPKSRHESYKELFDTLKQKKKWN
jgi:ribosome biogenesis GTPase